MDDAATEALSLVDTPLATVGHVMLTDLEARQGHLDEAAQHFQFWPQRQANDTAEYYDEMQRVVIQRLQPQHSLDWRNDWSVRFILAPLTHSAI